MWLSKPVYEVLPYYYVALGVLALATIPYVDYWYWPTVCRVVGGVALAGGALVWIKRRSHRAAR